MITYYGFFDKDASITQGLHQGAIDVSNQPNWYDWIYAPYQTGYAGKISWRVIRSNAIDKDAMNVKYSAIQRADGKDDITFAFFHTDECPFKKGDIIYSGDFLCKTAPNGKYKGPHVHVSPRRKEMSVSVNPYSVLDWYQGGKYNLGVVKGKNNYAPVPTPPNPINYEEKYNQLKSAVQEFTVLMAKNEQTEKDFLAKMNSI